LAIFFNRKSSALILTKWATLWAIFSPTHLVTLTSLTLETSFELSNQDFPQSAKKILQWGAAVAQR
jgi:hypothetical protein